MKVITINWTPGDFVRDTQHMTHVELSAYTLILQYLVIRGQDSDPASLPADDSTLASITKLTKAQWRKVKPRLCEGDLKVLEIANGRITQMRMALEVQQAKERIGGQSEKGKKSGEARRAKKEIRERFMNQAATAVRTAVEPVFEPNAEKDPEKTNRTGTSNESRITSNEEPVVLTTPVLLPEDGIAAVEVIDRTLATIAPTLSPPDEFTVAMWLRDIHPHEWCIAATLCGAELSLKDAKGFGYLTGILRNRNEWPCATDAKGYVLYMLNPERRSKLAAIGATA